MNRTTSSIVDLLIKRLGNLINLSKTFTASSKVNLEAEKEIKVALEALLLLLSSSKVHERTPSQVCEIMNIREIYSPSIVGVINFYMPLLSYDSDSKDKKISLFSNCISELSACLEAYIFLKLEEDIDSSMREKQAELIIFIGEITQLLSGLKLHEEECDELDAVLKKGEYSCLPWSLKRRLDIIKQSCQKDA